MLTYQLLVDGVRDRAAVDSGRQARVVVEAVVTTLAHALRGEARRRLTDALPAAVRAAADVPSASSEPRTGEAFVRQVGELVGETPERARYLTQAVVSQLRTEDPDLARDLLALSPPETAEVLAPAGESPGPP